MRTMNRFHLALIVFLLFSPSCGILPGIVYLPDILPRETDVPGWVPGELRRAKGEALLLMAPELGEYGPLDMVAKDYRRISGEDGEIRVEVFRFSSSLDSFGACGLEGKGAAVESDGGEWGNRFGSSILARRGPLYIRIRAVASGEEGLESFAAVIHEKARRAFPKDGLPRYLVALGRGAAGGVVYRRKGIDQVPGVKGVFILTREITGKRREVFFSPQASDEDALRSFRDLIGRVDLGWNLSRAGTIQPAVRIIPGGHILYLHYYKEWLYGVLNADTIDEGNGMILDLYREIRDLTGDGESGS